MACRFSLILILLMLPIHGMADTIARELRLSDGQTQSLNYLLGFVGQNRADLREFKPEKIAALLKFLVSSKENGNLYHADERNGTPSAYFEADIASCLDQILKLTYHPDIPVVFQRPRPFE